MTAELINKIIQYLVKRPYSEVFELMDEIRAEVEKLNSKQIDDPLSEEE